MRYAGRLPSDQTAQWLGNQLMRSATSVGAAYRAACRAQSRNDFLAKLALVEQEADEAAYWLELAESLEVVSSPDTARLRAEASEIVAMTVASIRTARTRRRG